MLEDRGPRGASERKTCHIVHNPRARGCRLVNISSDPLKESLSKDNSHGQGTWLGSVL